MTGGSATRAQALREAATQARLAVTASACAAAAAVCEYLAAQPLRRFPAVLGVNGAQGSGKSTLAALIALALEGQWRQKATILSLDDFYLTKDARLALAREVHPLCATRGVPGTHDVRLLLSVLSSLLIAGEGTQIAVPRFSKLDDDRLERSEWPLVEGKPDVIIFEGWCAGMPADRMAPWRGPINALEREADPEGTWVRWSVERLAEDYTALWKMIDTLVTIGVPDLETVIESRLRQEQGLQDDRRRARMDRGQVERFVQHYERYTRAMWDVMPRISDIVLRRGRDFDYVIERLPGP